MSKRFSVVAIILVVILILAGCGTNKPATSTGAAQTAQSSTVADGFDYYKGKTVTIIVPYAPGGGYDALARMIVPYLQKNLGATVVVQNVQGAGGIIGVNQVYTSSPEGLTLGFSDVPGMLFSKLDGSSGAKFDLAKFTWLPRLGYETHLIVVNPKKGINSVDDLLLANKEIKVSSVGVGDGDWYNEMLMKKFLKLNIRPVTGYSGQNECNLAAVKGEVDATLATQSSVQTLLESKDLTVVLQMSDKPDPAYPNVPTVVDLAKKQGDSNATNIMQAIVNTYQLERVFFAPPGIPDARVKALREALDKSIQDPNFQAATAKGKRPIVWASGDDVTKMVQQIASQDATLSDALKAATKK